MVGQGHHHTSGDGCTIASDSSLKTDESMKNYEDDMREDSRSSDSIVDTEEARDQVHDEVNLLKQA